MTHGPDPACREVVLVRYPAGLPEAGCFAVRRTARPDPGAGELLVRVADLSLDPYLLAVMTGRHLGGRPPTPLGSVPPGRAVAEVARSTDPAHPVGSWVLAETGWREWAVVPARAVEPVALPAGVRRSAVLGPLGMPGLTAYAAVTRHVRPRVGDTVVVSSATGGVGSVAGQLARLAGARTVAVVGSAAKAGLATGRFRYAAAVVRTDPDWREQLAAAAPRGVDGYLHMGGAEVLDGVVRQLAHGARISLCGLSGGDGAAPPAAVPAGPLMVARAELHGMVVDDHADLVGEQRRRITDLLLSGELRIHEHRVRGLAAAPAAFAHLMAGRNRGKVVVEVG